MNNPLSDLYSKVLLNEAKKNDVVASKKKLDMLPGPELEIEPLAKGRGIERVAKSSKLKTPAENAKYSALKKKKGKSLEMENTNNKYEGAFEKLFKSTLNEEFGADEAAEHEVEDHADEMPTSDEDMGEELGAHEDEADDLVSDIKAVIDSLNSILGKLSEHEKEEGHDMESEEEGGEEEPFEESLATDEAEEEGHALVDAKKLEKGLVGPKGKFNTGGVKTTSGKASAGNIENDPELKSYSGNRKELENTKKFGVKSSNIRVGDFFK
jgi:hypothetical protein